MSYLISIPDPHLHPHFCPPQSPTLSLNPPPYPCTSPSPQPPFLPTVSFPSPAVSGVPHVCVTPAWAQCGGHSTHLCHTCVTPARAQRDVCTQVCTGEPLGRCQHSRTGVSWRPIPLTLVSGPATSLLTCQGPQHCSRCQWGSVYVWPPKESLSPLVLLGGVPTLPCPPPCPLCPLCPPPCRSL